MPRRKKEATVTACGEREGDGFCGGGEPGGVGGRGIYEGMAVGWCTGRVVWVILGGWFRDGPGEEKEGAEEKGYPPDRRALFEGSV